MKKLFLLVTVISISSANAADFFIKANAEYADGTKKEFLCERAAGAKNKNLVEGNLPSAKNAYKNYSFQCLVGTDFFGISIKIKSAEDIVAAAFKPYDGTTKTWGDMDTPTFTFKAKVSGKEMQVHSFKGTPQHYKPEATSLKITEFKEEKEGVNDFHVVAGEGAGAFEDKKMGTSVGRAGTVKFSFRVRPEFKASRY